MASSGVTEEMSGRASRRLTSTIRVPAATSPSSSGCASRAVAKTKPSTLRVRIDSTAAASRAGSLSVLTIQAL